MKTYILIEGVKVDEEMFTQKFACDYSVCEGACCWVETGLNVAAPLYLKEHKELRENKEAILPFIGKENKERYKENLPTIKFSGKEAEEVGKSGEYFTSRCGGQTCIYSSREHETCSLKLAYAKKVISFDVPVYCGLYPANKFVQDGQEHIEVLHSWDDMCEGAFIKGEKEGIPLFRFLQTRIEQSYSTQFYQALEDAYKLIIQSAPRK